MGSMKENFITVLKFLCALAGLVIFLVAVIAIDLIIKMSKLDPDHKKPKPVFDLAWNVLDEECMNKRIRVDCYVYDRLLCMRTLSVGKTKRIRLPEKKFYEFKAECDDESIKVDVADPFIADWREDLERYEKLDSYEIIVWKIPQVLEDDESFTIVNPLEGIEYEICYWSVNKRRFVRVKSSNGKFLKDEYVPAELEYSVDELGKEYPSGTEKALVTFSIMSMKSDGNEVSHKQKFEFDRDEKFLPPKPVTRTYIQNGITITTENLELNGTQWISTRYIDKETGNPLCNRKVQIHFIPDDRGEDLDDHLILTETDDDGWLRVENISDGGEVYALFQ